MKTPVIYTTMRSYADLIEQSLTPLCEKIHIAGSLRRYERYCEQKTVGDIEFVLTPRRESRQTLFEEESTTKVHNDFITFFSEKEIKLIDGITIIHQRGNPEGRYMQYVLHHMELEISVELCMPELYDYYRILAIRTGPSEYSHKVLAKRWVEMGWRGTTDGLRLEKECYAIPQGDKTLYKCIARNPEKPPAWTSEQDFFTWLGLPYPKPHERHI